MTHQQTPFAAAQDQQLVTITIDKRFIPCLLGALRLGVWLEDWCACLVQSAIGTYDSHSRRWCNTIIHLIVSIKEQTGADQEWKEYAESDVTIEDIAKWVEAKCAEYSRALDEQYGK